MTIFSERVGTDLGASNWESADQAMVDAYTALIGDGGPIHNDPSSPAAQALGGTIVQGSYLLGSLVRLAKQVEFPADGVAYRLNYGFDRVRIVRPVPTGARFRAHFKIAEVRPKSDTADLVRLEVTIELQGSDEPVLVANWLAYIQYES